ncbi:MAG: protein phosphatase 2C domain-containing protein [Pseudomonadota bacterium]
MDKLVIRHYGATEQMDRKTNQDYFYADSKEHLYLIADGMGGYEGGDFASRFASHVTGEMIKLVDLLFKPIGDTTFLHSDVNPKADNYMILLEKIVRVVNKELNEEAKRLAYKKMGTTLSFLLFRRSSVYSVNVGDSPCYRYSEGVLRQITRSHSKVDDMVREEKLSKEGAEDHPESNIVRRWLGGMKDGAWADITIMPVYINDRFFMCTDGVSKILKDKRIESLLATQKPKEAAGQILQAVKDAPQKERAGKPILKDNATVIIVDVVRVPETKGISSDEAELSEDAGVEETEDTFQAG